MKCLPLILAAQFSLAVSIAQSRSGRISGNVKEPSGKYLDAVTVSLLKFPDSSLIKTALTNKDGLFRLENLPPGRYIVSITFVGYSPWISQGLQISASKQDIKLNDITLQSSVSSLG
ncbi:MAG TPA: carboxypeptidase-like regulatory domain-containing protein, partial [Puia sp.]|nr:carboxypeptidase-like regulatory domain-containing protein [Puia sp.]